MEVVVMQLLWVGWVVMSLGLIAIGAVLEVYPGTPRRAWERLRFAIATLRDPRLWASKRRLDAWARRSRGPWVQTLSGARWYPYSPRVEDVVIRDFGACAHINRWGGHAGRCALAEHQVRVAELLREWGADEEVQLEGALHDVHEVYPPGDVAGPVFWGPRWIAWAFRWMSSRAERTVRARLAMPASFDPLVHKADLAMLSAEAHDRLPGGPQGWKNALPPPPPNYVGWPWDPSYAAFRWWTLVAELSRVVARRARQHGDPKRAAVLQELERTARREAAALAPAAGA